MVLLFLKIAVVRRLDDSLVWVSNCWFGSRHDSRVVGSRPTSGSALGMEPASLLLPLSPAHGRSFSPLLSQNKERERRKGRKKLLHWFIVRSLASWAGWGTLPAFSFFFNLEILIRRKLFNVLISEIRQQFDVSVSSGEVCEVPPWFCLFSSQFSNQGIPSFPWTALPLLAFPHLQSSARNKHVLRGSGCFERLKSC